MDRLLLLGMASLSWMDPLVCRLLILPHPLLPLLHLLLIPLHPWLLLRHCHEFVVVIVESLHMWPLFGSALSRPGRPDIGDNDADRKIESRNANGLDCCNGNGGALGCCNAVLVAGKVGVSGPEVVCKSSGLFLIKSHMSS